MAQITSIFPTEQNPGYCCGNIPTRLVIYNPVDESTPSDAYFVCEQHWIEAEHNGRRIWQDDAMRVTELKH